MCSNIPKGTRMYQVDAKDFAERINTIRAIELKLAEKNVWFKHTKGTPAFSAFERVHYMIAPDPAWMSCVHQMPDKALAVAKEIMAVASEVLNENP